MSFKVYRKENQFYVVDNTDNRVYEGLAIDVLVTREFIEDSGKYYFRGLKGNFNQQNVIDIADLQDETGEPYTDDSFVAFYEVNTGESISSSSGGGATSAKQDEQTTILNEIKNALTVPLQSETFNIGAGEEGNFPSGFYQIINTGNSDILINGEVWEARLPKTWQGSFDYDSQLSTINITSNP